MDREYIKAVVLGHAVGDALGVPVEFCSRQNLDLSPVTDMMGYGSHRVPEGSWSDDTSMSLAALDSLKSGKVDFYEIMSNFEKWFYEDEYTPEGKVFDIGSTCLGSIAYFHNNEGVLPTECGADGELTNGNGSLMRIHPFVLFAYAKRMSISDTMTLVDMASSLTHSHPRSRLACKIYAFVLIRLLQERTVGAIHRALDEAKIFLANESELHHFERLFSRDFVYTPRNEIRSTGYVVDTIEAAIWCVLTTKDYKECVLKAANLGRDTDTVAAVAGGLASALYGYSSIPESWLNTLRRKDYIEQICDVCRQNW